MPYFNNTPPVTRISADNVIYGSYTKMDKLDGLVYDCFAGTSIAAATELNVFIDLYSVLHALFSENYRIDTPSISIITSCLINMCGHYRNFFSRIRVKTNFYMVFSKNIHEINRKYVAGYNEVFYNKSSIKESVDFTKANFDMLRIICPYLPDIHFIESQENFESSVIIAGIIQKLNDGLPNLIISKDLYPIQLTSTIKNTALLVPKKSREGDISFMIPINESYSHKSKFWNYVAASHKIKVDRFASLSTLNSPLFFALTSMKERNMLSLATPNQAAKIIREIIGDEDIKISSDQLLSMPEVMEKYPLVDRRCKALDVSFMLPYYLASPEFRNLKFVNLRDDAKLRQICSMEIFENNPIDLRQL